LHYSAKIIRLFAKKKDFRLIYKISFTIVQARVVTGVNSMTQAQKSEEYQTLLNKLPGVVSSKVLLDENGHITDIHILADIGRGAKQIARDVQSALLTKYDIGVDHKIISIA